MKDDSKRTGLWGPGNNHLVVDENADAARKWIEEFEAYNESQAQQQQEILKACDAHSDILLRDCFPGHLTASALVVDHDCEKVLLHHHAKLGRWLQFGGHCDGDGNLAHVAWRECCEESGIDDLWIMPQVIDVDIHGIPPLGDEPEHKHLDIRFMVFVDGSCRPVASNESKEVRWFDFEELSSLETDDSVLRLAKLAKELEI